MIENELPGKNARAMLPLLEEIAERDAEIDRLRAVLRQAKDALMVGHPNPSVMEQRAKAIAAINSALTPNAKLTGSALLRSPG